MDESGREPLFNAPWPVVALVGALLAAYAIQSAVGTDAVASRLGFSAASLEQGRVAPLIVSLFLHGSWPHVLANSAFVFAFGTPVARRCGRDLRGALAFLGFFLVCGVLANLGFAAVEGADGATLVGASGAASGLMAGAARLMTRGPGLAPLRSPPVLGMTAAWLAVNLLLAALGAMGLWSLSPGSGGAPVAWQAHLVGYAVGLFLFGPLLKLLGRDERRYS